MIGTSLKTLSFHISTFQEFPDFLKFGHHRKPDFWDRMCLMFGFVDQKQLVCSSVLNKKLQNTMVES